MQQNNRRVIQIGSGAHAKNEEMKFPSNYISTTKYNFVTFLPFAIIFQFRRYANVYFLLIAIVQSLPIISPLSPITAILPLAFVISLSVIREGIQDFSRYKSDKQNNSSATNIFFEGEFVLKKWSEVRVGDLVRVKSDEIIPADLAIVVSSNQEGICFVETSSLDGQKTLKNKSSPKETQLLYNDIKQNLFKTFSASVQCGKPNENLNQFEGVLRFAEQKISLGPKQLLLRGAKFMNTEWAVGIVVHTGNDTKIMMNGCTAHIKISKVQKKVNYFILGILFFQVICCITASAYTFFMCRYNNSQWLLEGFQYSCITIGTISFFSYFLLNNTMIPISLIVSLQIVKIAQGIFMQQDNECYSKIRDKNLKCLTVSLNEQLGQIQYICTDKTGTLTCNKMEFRTLVFGNYTFTLPEQQVQNVNFQKQSSAVDHYVEVGQRIEEDRQLENQLRFHDGDVGLVYKKQSEVIRELLYMLSSCHQCVSQPDQTGSLVYKGQSPDQITLVSAAASMGFAFNNVKNSIIHVTVNGQQQRIQLLHVFQFNSDRKRMSVVVRHGDRIKLYCKGADSIIEARLAPGQPFKDSIKEQINRFSRKGLRTLLFAMKIIPPEVYQKAKSEIISSLGTACQKTVLEEQMAYFQSDLMLLGASALQDKLQDKVPQVLKDFLHAKIKVMMLTGDKLETAESIAKSCNLLPEGIRSFVFEGDQIPQLADHEQFVFFLQGQRLLNFDEQKKKKLKSLIYWCKSAVFCRVSPKQKAEVVSMVKELGQTVLAVGDGSNDVNMILQANVGVGIYGQQGARAVNVANYSIGQFKILWKLLLYHGRLNYIRISDMILYFFYKNMVFTIPQTVFCFFCNGSGMSIFDNWGITLYNMVFTLLPVMIRAVFEVDVFVQQGEAYRTDKTISNNLYLAYPKLYYVSQMNLIFQTNRFIKWLLLGFGQGVICFLIIFFSLGGQNVTGGNQGYQTKYQFVSITLYTAIIFMVTLKLAINTQFWNFLTWTAYIVSSIGSYLLFMLVSDVVPISGIYLQTNSLITMPAFYLALVYSIMGMFSLDLLMFTNQALKQNLHNYVRYETELNTRSLQKLEKKVDRMYSKRGNREVELSGLMRDSHLLVKQGEQ